MSAWERSSAARVVPPARPRKLAKVPFVELADGRLRAWCPAGRTSSGCTHQSMGSPSSVSRWMVWVASSTCEPEPPTARSPLREVRALGAEGGVVAVARVVGRYVEDPG